MTQSRFRPERIPAAFFGMVLGIFGIGNAWRHAASLWQIPSLAGDLIVGLAIGVWLLLSLAFGYKWLRHTGLARGELDDPHAGSFVSLFPATTILVAIGLLPWLPEVGRVLLVGGVLLQLGIAAWGNAGLWRGRHVSTATTPGFYLPTVASNFISAIGLASYGHRELGMLFLGAGLFSWLMLEPLILHRLRNEAELPAPQRPVIGIQLAPAFVACLAWLAVNGGQIDVFAHLLFGYGVLQLLFLARLLPWVMQQPFSPGYWAYSFGITAMATTGLHLATATTDDLVRLLALGLFWLANLLIALLLLRTLHLLASGRLLPRG